MRTLYVLLSLIALAFVVQPAGAAAPVRVASNPQLGGIVLGGTLLYPGSSDAAGLELWRSDGTETGTALVKDLLPGAESSYPNNFVVAGGLAYFTAQANGVHAIWKSDGTTLGTTHVMDLPGVPALARAVGTNIFFNLTEAGEWSVWISDGNFEGTRKLKEGFGYLADEFTAAAGFVFFGLDDGETGEELWMTDGTPVGTRLVRDIIPGDGAGFAYDLRAVSGYLLFAARNDQSGIGLWRSTGTEAGTVPVGLRPIVGDVGPVLDNAVLLTVDDSAGSQLWRSDGTAAGSYAVGDLFPASSSPSQDFIEHLGIAYFSSASRSGAQPTLFRSDGTAAGTAEMLAPMPPTATVPRALGGAAQEIYFVAQEGSAARAVWGADRNLRIARKRFEITSEGDAFFGSFVAPGGLFLQVQRGGDAFASELWFMAAENPAGDSDVDGVPDGVEPGEGLDAQAKDNDIFASARLFAMQQYRDFLVREGDSGGIDFYTLQINGGAATRGQVIENFLGSPEFQNGLPQCTRLYFSFFLRIPDFSGLMFQVGQFRSGVPLEVISQNFSNSPEFTNRYGALTNEQYVDLVYQNVLGRAPDPDGRQYYLERLGDGRLTRGQMMIGFSESPEFQQIIDNEVHVTAVYVGMLQRAPDPAGMDFYVGQIEGGTPRNAIINGFLGSPEYRARFLP